MHSAPVFIIIGQSNEGKSSIVSTLVGHDKVKVESAAGTTQKHRKFAFEVDGEEVMGFIDTPGFDQPRKILQWLQKNKSSYETSKELFDAFHEKHYDKKKFYLDCELLLPIKDHTEACILYVFDGSRPMDERDKWAMEIVRLTGCGRIALINCKEDNSDYKSKWKNECNQFFSSVREFNAHTATFRERLNLLQNMGALVQNLEAPLEIVIHELERKRKESYKNISDYMIESLREMAKFSVKKNYTKNVDVEITKKKLSLDYKKGIEEIEKKLRRKIKEEYKHEIFDVEIPLKSLINEDLFDQSTWQLLGLNSTQMIVAATGVGGLSGAGLGAWLSPLTGGTSVGVGALVGATAAGLAAYAGGGSMVNIKIKGIKLGGHQMTVGPNKNTQFYFILVDRMLIYYSYMVKRAHGKRNEANVKIQNGEKQGFTSQWNKDDQQKCQKFLSQTTKGKSLSAEEEGSLQNLFVTTLLKIEGVFSDSRI